MENIFLKKLELFIGKGDLDQAFKIALEQGFSGKIHRTITLLSGQFEQAKTDRQEGNLENDDYSKNINRISASLLTAIKDHFEKIEATQNLEALMRPNGQQDSNYHNFDGRYRRNVQDWEVVEWESHLEQSKFNEEQCRKALHAIKQWKKVHQHSVFRAWGEFSSKKTKLQWLKNRFWGLFNFRQDQDKWVWLAWDAEKDILVFVKEMRPGCNDQDKIKRLEWEKEVYQKIHAPTSSEKFKKISKGTIKLVDSGVYWFATAFAAYGSLYWQLYESNHISKVSNARLTPEEKVQKDIFKKIPEKDFSEKNWPLVQQLFTQFSGTLEALHDMSYIHRDIHPANLLIDEFDLHKGKVTAYICDFDRTRINDEVCPDFLKLDGQTLCAPERIKPMDLSDAEDLNIYHGLPACDVYSLASTLLISLLKREIKHHHVRLSVLKEQEGWPRKLVDLLLEAMSDDPDDRPDTHVFAQRLHDIQWPGVIERVKRRYYIATAFSLLFFAMIFFSVSYLQKDNPILDPDCKDFTCLEGEFTNGLHLKSTEQYLLKDKVFILEGTLKIDPGTKIYGKSESFLLIGQNARIDARGVPYEPIHFTSWRDHPDNLDSPEAGDWGGVIILGKAPVSGKENLEFCSYRNNEEDDRCSFGGNQPDHSSGIFKFVRIEYAGKIMGENEEVNGLTLAGVGNRTIIEYISIGHVIDDCYEFFGGTVNANHLVCEDPADDAFDFENGYNGSLSFLLMKGMINDDQNKKGSIGKARAGIEGTGPDKLSDQEGPKLSNITLCSKYYSEDDQTIKPVSFDNDVRPSIQNLLVIGDMEAYPNAYLFVDALEINKADSLLVFSEEVMPELNCDWGSKGIKPKAIISGLQITTTKGRIVNYIGAFKTDKDNWETLLEPQEKPILNM